MDKILYAFDLDDTLVKTPDIMDILKVSNGKINTGEETIDHAFEETTKLIKKIIQFEQKHDVERMKNLAGIENDVYYLKDENIIKLYINGKEMGKDFFDTVKNTQHLSPKEKKTILNKFEIKNSKVVIKDFSEFYKTEMTIGTEPNEEILKIYNSVKNRAIITGRTRSLKKATEYVLYNFVGIEPPEYGLYMFAGSFSDGIPAFKVNVIEHLINKFNFTEVYFYDDKEEWLEYIKTHVENTFPSVKINIKFVK